MRQSFAPSPQQRRAVQVAGLSSAASTNLGAAFRIEGSLGLAALTASLEKLATTHEILCTDVVPHGEGIAQEIAAPTPFLTEEGPDDADNARAALLAFAEKCTRNKVHKGASLVSVTGQAHLLLVMVNTLADAKSLEVLAQALASTLNGDEVEQPRDEDGTALQYADLAVQQEDLLKDEDSQAGAEHLASLPLSHGTDQRLGLERSITRGQGFDEVLRPLTEKELGALQAIATRAGCSRSAVALAAWSTIVARQADVAEPILGLASAGRDYEGLELALGPFEKLVPLTLGPRADDSFDQLAIRAQSAIERALEDHDAWDPASTEAPQLLPHAFAWRTPFEAVAGSFRLTLGARCGQSDHAKVNLAFEGVRTTGGSSAMGLRVCGDNGALRAGELGVLADQVLTLLCDAHTNPQPSAAAQSATSKEWREHFAKHLATTPAGKRRVETITRLFGEATQIAGEASCVQDAKIVRSYSDLDQHTNRIARHLSYLGVRPGQFVGIHLERGVPMIEAILGVLKAGAAYLPLPPSYPDERLRFMLEDSEAPLVITSTLRSGDLPATQAQVVILDQLAEELASLDNGAMGETHGPDDPAYVIYTSGSTGMPKGVPITHANLCHSIRAREEYYPEKVGAYLLLSSFAFDSSVPGIFWTLTSGGNLVLPPEGAERELGQLPALVQEYGVTHLLCLPSVFDLLLESAGSGALNSLRCVIVAGESSTPDLVVRHGEKLLQCALYNEYGPTENTVWSTVQRCTSADEFFTVPIGRPVPGVCAIVAAPTDSPGEATPPIPLPAGMPGELLIGGPQLTPGYLGRPELTAERFMESGSGARLYRTGDLARMHLDGTIEFLGRLDYQVKLRGYRIELEEIEARLAERDEVREAIVSAPDFATEGKPADRRLVGYVLAKNAEVDVEALRQHLGACLPEYMVPAHIVVLSELPRLPNGKVDRRALPLPTKEGGHAEAAGASLGSALEKLIAHFWTELLDEDAVGLDEDFFDLGGHSLLAARFFAQLNETLQIEAPLRFLFDNPTVRGLSSAIESSEGGARAARAAELTLEVLGIDQGTDGATDGPKNSALERLVGTLWADGLGVDQVDPDEDFFDLGGHSLLAARLFAQMNELLQVEAPLRLLFDNPTVRGLCAAMPDGDPAEATRLERTAELTLEVLEGE